VVRFGAKPKGYPTWSLELTSDYSPYDAGLGGFVKLTEGRSFIGCEALADLALAPANELCIFEIDADDADAFGGEPIIHDGVVVGEVSSGGYGHRVGASLALGYIRLGAIPADAQLEIDVVGRPRAARRLPTCPYDPTGELLRA